MKGKILKFCFVAALVTFMSFSSSIPVKSQSASGNYCLASHTKKTVSFGIISYHRIDYYWCDGSHTYVTAWY